MVPGLQIAGLFLAITAALAFTAWAEAWLASTAGSITRSQPNAKPSVARALADPGTVGAAAVPRSARPQGPDLRPR